MEKSWCVLRARCKSWARWCHGLKSYLPSAERLTVVLVKARNLKIVDMSRNSSDPYVKLSLIHNGKKIKKRKSGIYRNTTCPVFNEALTFDIPKDTLKMCSIELLVSHDSLLGKCGSSGVILSGIEDQHYFCCLINSEHPKCWFSFPLNISFAKLLVLYNFRLICRF